MNEVDVDSIELRLELRELVQAAFLRAPIKSIAPVLDEASQISETHAVVPASSLGFVGKSCTRQTRLQILQDIVGDVNHKWYHSITARRANRLRRRRQNGA